MKIYLVGGAVRDKLLGLPIKERDWVVVGSTIEEMLNLGYRQVGKEFPVFLHPKTNEEYALARIERKIHTGYKGFVFDTSSQVMLEADLQRRDLTINAIAEADNGELIDPYQGKKDLDHKILRHVSTAFAEDPVRILRVGRFLARYTYLGFQLAPETLALMADMVKKGEVNALVAERVWKELQRALGEKNPEKFFQVLDNCQALTILFPDLVINGHGIRALTAAVTLTNDPVIRFASLLHALPEKQQTTLTCKKNAVWSLCERYRVPKDYHQLALLTSLYYEKALIAQTLSASDLLELFNALDVFRRERRFQQFLMATQAIALAHHLPFDPLWLTMGANKVKSFNVQTLLDQGLTGNELVLQLKNKRQEIIEDWQKQ